MRKIMTTPIQTAESVLTPVTNEVTSWFKVHEKLIIVFLFLLLSFFVLDKSLSIVASWEQHRASVAAAQVAADKAKSDSDLTQAKELLQSYQNLLQSSQAENAKLQEGIVSRDAALATQQKADVTLPPSQLAERWQTLVSDSGIQADTSSFNVSDSAALATVSKLEQVPVLQLDLKDEQSKTANLQASIDKANELIGQGKTTITDQQKQLQDQTKACNAQVAAVKAEARKGKVKAFGIGYGLGLVSGLVAHAFGF